jgi:hypothetical protein
LRWHHLVARDFTRAELGAAPAIRRDLAFAAFAPSPATLAVAVMDRIRLGERRIAVDSDGEALLVVTANRIALAQVCCSTGSTTKPAGWPPTSWRARPPRKNALSVSACCAFASQSAPKRSERDDQPPQH